MAEPGRDLLKAQASLNALVQDVCDRRWQDAIRKYEAFREDGTPVPALIERCCRELIRREACGSSYRPPDATHRITRHSS